VGAKTATFNMSGRLVARATQVRAQTVLAQLVSLVNQARATETAAQRLADRLAGVVLVPRASAGRVSA
jgi:P-type Cu+ transporter